MPLAPCNPLPYWQRMRAARRFDTDGAAERAATPMSWELRRLMGDNLLVVPHEDWLPRRRALQPVFTKQHVPRFAGHMADAAQ